MFQETDNNNNNNNGRIENIRNAGVRRGRWTREEDNRLSAYIQRYGHWNWRVLPKFADLLRSGRICKLCWFNHLSRVLKPRNFSEQEDELIINLHNAIGNKWSLISARLPGRTDHQIRNHWNTQLRKKASNDGGDGNSKSNSSGDGDGGDGDGGGDQTGGSNGNDDGDDGDGDGDGDNDEGSFGGGMEGNQINYMGRPGFDYRYGYHAGSENGNPVGQLHLLQGPNHEKSIEKTHNAIAKLVSEKELVAIKDCTMDDKMSLKERVKRTRSATIDYKMPDVIHKKNGNEFYGHGSDGDNNGGQVKNKKKRCNEMDCRAQPEFSYTPRYHAEGYSVSQLQCPVQVQ